MPKKEEDTIRNIRLHPQGVSVLTPSKLSLDMSYK